ncbi:MAG TPA: SH3 domain-containing protein [Aurantimonas sp.]|uniref:SH3 domain-containing protein n=1 Tax=Aurantimonas marianensis TaxID=2920428 RepID=A0A9X2H2K1_9HYPH|nr:SH3 domain-containing protein [Aurantimonas marianensis]MCP3054082.1 SH3 domain-containing protein [Aurantimonas marianensis]
MNKMLLGLLAAVGGFALPATADAASRAIATADVNLRAGPSTRYPAVDVVASGDRVRVYGCLESRAWCDVGYDGQRGWMSSNYLAYAGGNQRYTGERAIRAIEAPVISFSIGGYWDDHYRARRFYRERDRYDDFRSRRYHRERDRFDDDDFRHDRAERRELRREIRRELRREDRRELRRDERGERHWERRDERRISPSDDRPDPVVPLYRVN